MPQTRPYDSLRAKGEDRKQRILAVAQRLLTRNGWRNTTLAQIAGEAGVTPAGLLHHFESKEQLLHAVLDIRDADDDAHADRAGDLISEVAAVAVERTVMRQDHQGQTAGIGGGFGGSVLGLMPAAPLLEYHCA